MKEPSFSFETGHRYEKKAVISQHNHNIQKKTMKSDIEIAHSIKLKPIGEVALSLGIRPDDIEMYGKYIAKLPLGHVKKENERKGKLILVTAITATKAGIGKTTCAIGLALGLNHIGKKSIVVLREPSLGPCFGLKGGAAGGGFAQVLPMEKINLHFTGDFHAITTAHNLIAALLDNYIYQHQREGFALKEKTWRRVMDINDRGLRQIVTGIGPRSNGGTMQSGFDITPASELMAIFCLANSWDDLRRRVGNILLGYTFDGKPFRVDNIGATGAVMALLKDALMPNLVQTTEGSPAIIHGGPFANIAHGCNSLLATQMALSYGDYVVTEAGFGADLGAEKFYDIKCRVGHLQPALSILVVTMRGLKMHGGALIENTGQKDTESLKGGFANLDKHAQNLKSYGQTVLVVFNHYNDDDPEEISLLKKHCTDELHVEVVENDAYSEGGKGAVNMAKAVVKIIDEHPSAPLHYAYDLNAPVKQKIDNVAQNIYGAREVVYSSEAERKIKDIEMNGMGNMPVCIAKTQYSFTDNEKDYKTLNGFEFHIRDIIINAGAEMIVAIAGNIMRMPGLPKMPQANNIDVVDGEIVGLN